MSDEPAAKRARTASGAGAGAGADLAPAEGTMLFAVPKKGRLYERILKILDGCGLSYHRKNRLDVALCTNMPIKLVFLPAKDIAQYVGQGNVDMGITGQDIVAEAGVTVEEVCHLGMGKCKLAVQAPVADHVTDPATLAKPCRVSTSFPNLTRQYFERLVGKDKCPTISYVSGSVEAACALGLADAVVDLVETGTTMRAAGLEIVGEVMKTATVLIVNPKTQHRALVKQMVARLTGYLTAQRYSLLTYNVERAKQKEAARITPGKKAPTVMPLDDDKWCAISVLVLKKEVAGIMDRLATLGATDMLNFNLSNYR